MGEQQADSRQHSDEAARTLRPEALVLWLLLVVDVDHHEARRLVPEGDLLRERGAELLRLLAPRLQRTRQAGQTRGCVTEQARCA